MLATPSPTNSLPFKEQSMNIQQAMALRASLEANLTESVRRFQEETGLTVTDISIRQYDVSVCLRRYMFDVKVEVSL